MILRATARGIRSSSCIRCSGTIIDEYEVGDVCSRDSDVPGRVRKSGSGIVIAINYLMTEHVDLRIATIGKRIPVEGRSGEVGSLDSGINEGLIGREAPVANVEGRIGEGCAIKIIAEPPVVCRD